MAYYANGDNDIKQLDVEIAKLSADAVERLNVHIVNAVEGEESVPLNVLRNVASVGVTTSHMMHVDIDFLPSYNMHEIILYQQHLLVFVDALVRNTWTC